MLPPQRERAADRVLCMLLMFDSRPSVPLLCHGLDLLVGDAGGVCSSGEGVSGEGVIGVTAWSCVTARSSLSLGMQAARDGADCCRAKPQSWPSPAAAASSRPLQTGC